MNKRQYLLIQAWAYAAVAITTLIIFVFKPFSEIDEFGVVFGIIFLMFLSYKSYAYFKAIKSTSEKDQAYAPPSDAAKPEILNYYKMIFYSSVPAFIILSVWIYHDLKEFEAGNVETVRLWTPIVFLYEVGGFWLAILATPVLAIICWFVFWKVIKKTKASAELFAEQNIGFESRYLYPTTTTHHNSLSAYFKFY